MPRFRFRLQTLRRLRELTRDELRVRLAYPTPQKLLDEVAPRDLRKQLALPI